MEGKTVKMEMQQVRQIIDEALAVHVYEHHRQRNPHFKPPTQAEVEAYKVEKNLPLNVTEFMDFYESKGWKVGQAPMKDWKAAARRAAREWCKAPAKPETVFRCFECGRSRRETEMVYVHGRGRRCKELCV